MTARYPAAGMAGAACLLLSACAGLTLSSEDYTKKAEATVRALAS